MSNDKNDFEYKSSNDDLETDKPVSNKKRPWNNRFSENENLKNRQYSRAARNQPVKEASKLSQILLLMIALLVLIPFILYGIIQSQVNNKEITSRTANEIMISRNENIAKESEEKAKAESTDESKTETSQTEISSEVIEETTVAQAVVPEPEPQPQPEPQPEPANTGTVHTVSAGESWWAIARMYGVDPYELAAYNGSTIESALFPGSTVQVP